MDNDLMPQEFLSNSDFSVISFYNSSDESKEIDGLIDGAKMYFDTKLADGDWPDRQVAWYRIDIEKYPDMAFDESNQPNQLITGQGWNKLVHF